MNGSNVAIGHASFAMNPHWLTMHVVPGNGADMYVRWGALSVNGTNYGWVSASVNGVWSPLMTEESKIAAYVSTLPAAYQTAFQIGLQVGQDTVKSSAYQDLTVFNPNGTCNQGTVLTLTITTITGCLTFPTLVGAFWCGAGGSLLAGCLVTYLYKPMDELDGGTYLDQILDGGVADNLYDPTDDDDWDVNDSGDDDSPGDGTPSGGGGECP